jgi:hypothetical protein
MQKKTELILGLFFLALMIAWAWVLVPSRLAADPDAIVMAMFPVGKDQRSYSDDQIIRAIRKYGSVDGFSQTHNLSFITAALAAGRVNLLQWLVSNGANPNPARGIHPLALCLTGDDERSARVMLRAGSKWSARTEDGRTVEQVAAECNPHLLGKLSRR